MGWLHTYPEGSKVSRSEQLRKVGSPWVNLPEVTLPQVVQLWIDCGMCLSGTNGAIQLTWQEIEAFSVSNLLSAWEKEQMRLMSKAYITGLSDKERISLPPYVSDDEDEIREGQIAMEKLIDETMQIPKV